MHSFCVLQLAPRPSNSSCGCLVHTLGESLCIHVPTICPNHTLLEKLRLEQASAVLSTPIWPNQLWYPSLLRALADYPILLLPVQDILIGPEGQSHPLVLQSHLPLAAWPISGDPSAPTDFRRKSLSLSGNLGGTSHFMPSQNKKAVRSRVTKTY